MSSSEPTSAAPPGPLARLALPAMASLTLGLAPFHPEPHVVGKLRWVLGGAEGMGGMDWFDLAFHGAPWVWLIGTAIVVAVDRLRSSAGAPPR